MPSAPRAPTHPDLQQEEAAVDGGEGSRNPVVLPLSEASLDRLVGHAQLFENQIPCSIQATYSLIVAQMKVQGLLTYPFGLQDEVLKRRSLLHLDI